MSTIYAKAVCVGSPQVLQLPPTVQKHKHYWGNRALDVSERFVYAVNDWWPVH